MSALTRVCPKCGDVWAAECDFCCSCGAPLVNREAMRNRERPRTPSPAKGRRYRNCIYCGGRSLGLACASHRELLGLDPGFRR